MTIASVITPDQLADIGRALFGERWQAALAAELSVGDRALRRWLTGESPIPENIAHELRTILIARVNTMGGMIGYSVHQADRRVFHYPTAACFEYDEADNLKLLNPNMVATEAVQVLKQGAFEALRQERERNIRGVNAGWVNPLTGQIAASGNVEIEYNEFIISYQRIPMFPGRWEVNIGSNNPRKMMMLGRDNIIQSYVSIEDAIEKAKRHVDAVYRHGN